MIEESKAVTLSEADLQLEVEKKTLGSLTTNAEKIRDMVKAALSQYAIENYSTDDIAKAKEDKAKLNKAVKALNSERLRLEKEWMSPFDSFKSVVNETVGIIKDCVNKIDTIIKEDDERTKSEKRDIINAIASRLEVTKIIPLEKIWNEKWLNKTTSAKSIEKEITESLAHVKADLETLKSFGDDYDALVVRYREDYDLSATILYANTLKELRGQNTQQAKVEEPTESPAPVVEDKKETSHRVDTDTLDAEDAFAAVLGEDVGGTYSPVKEMTIKVKVTSNQQTEIEQFLSQLGVTYNII